MAKILLVEDDQSLREIYSIRLTAEGYEIISAGDGEEALATAVRENPDLILSDVMMPKISGFDMLDILRATPETKDIKVIMMTALSSDDQRQRGKDLGADRYLVKSQVGIEDVVNAVHEVLSDMGSGSEPAPAATPAATAAPDVAPTETAPAEVMPPAPAPVEAQPEPAPELSAQPAPQPAPAPQPTPQPTPIPVFRSTPDPAQSNPTEGGQQ